MHSNKQSNLKWLENLNEQKKIDKLCTGNCAKASIYRFEKKKTYM